MNRRVLLLAILAGSLAFLAACPTSVVDYYPCPSDIICDGGMATHMGNGSSDVGGACMASSDCAMGTCITAPLLQALGVDTEFIDIPNGMCSENGCTTDLDCGDGGICEDGSAFGSSTTTLCLRACDNITDCRWKENYDCWVRDSNHAGVCLPASVIAAYYCPLGCP